MQADIRRGSIEMIAAMAILGTIGWFVLASGMPPLDVVFWRCVFGAATLLVVCGALGQFRRVLAPAALGWAVAGGAAIVLNWVLLFSAYKHASIALATMAYNTQPFILVAFGAIFLGEKPTFRQGAWLLLAFVGMVLVMQARPSASYVGANFLLGISMALGAAFFWAVAAFLAKKLTGTPPQLIAFIHVCTGTLMLAPFANITDVRLDALHWWPLVTLGVFHTGLMYILMYSAVQRLPTQIQGSLSFIYPLVAIGVDWWTLGHRLQPVQLLGGAAILAAAAGMTLGPRFLGTPRRAKQVEYPG